MHVYISQLMINPLARKVQRDLASPYEMHRTLLRAFPDNLVVSAAEGERMLYRIDFDAFARPVVLVQSHTAPDWAALDDGYLVVPAACKSFNVALAAGQRLGFRLRANPTVRKQFDGPGMPSKRIGIYADQEQTKWLARKLEQGGFRLLDATATRQDIVRGVIRRPAVEHDLRLLSVQFDGTLVVVESVKAAATVAQGIGSGKAFGFGLLSLARVS